MSPTAAARGLPPRPPPARRSLAPPRAPLANPALAAAGSGDTLAGLIAGLLAQGLAPDDAAILGLYLGSRAGELAQAAVGTLPLVAGDLPSYIGQAIRELEVDR